MFFTRSFPTSPRRYGTSTSPNLRLFLLSINMIDSLSRHRFYLCCCLGTGSFFRTSSQKRQNGKIPREVQKGMKLEKNVAGGVKAKFDVSTSTSAHTIANDVAKASSGGTDQGFCTNQGPASSFPWGEIWRNWLAWMVLVGIAVSQMVWFDCTEEEYIALRNGRRDCGRD
jgi:hypothetical protein